MTFVLRGEVKRGRITPTQSTIPRRRVKSDDPICSSTTRTFRERTMGLEWTLFLGYNCDLDGEPLPTFNDDDDSEEWN
jgi:hypothetical protein